MTVSKSKPALAIAAMLAVALFGCAHTPEPVNAATLEQERNCLALALYFEARGEGNRGMTAVGWTVMNRVHSNQFPGTPCRVVKQGGETPPCQFSWWCDGKSDRPRDMKSWNRAQMIAANLLTDPPKDPTKGALYFHNKSVMPRWSRTQTRTASIGSHIFYR